MGKPKNIKGRMQAPKRRNGNAIAAMRRKGSGPHKDNRKEKKENMETAISLKEFREEHGIITGSDMMDALTDWSMDSIVPALCSEGCEVEPDGRCSHDQPSILLRMGMV